MPMIIRNICVMLLLHVVGIFWLVPMTTTTTTVMGLSTTTTSSRTPPSQQLSRRGSMDILSSGAPIQSATSMEEMLDIAACMWLPNDENLPPHLETQIVHHEKRQRWASQLLSKLALATITTTTTTTDFCDDTMDNDDSSLFHLLLVTEERFGRVVGAAAQPCSFQIDRPDIEGRYIREALQGLHAILARQQQQQQSAVPIHDSVRLAICTLLERADNLALDPLLSLKDVCEMRWAARGIHTRILQQFDDEVRDDENKDDDDDSKCTIQRFQEISMLRLNQRVKDIPFDVIPCGIDWNYILALQNHQGPSTIQLKPGGIHDIDPVIPLLRTAIPFQFDTIVTRTGSSVMERRGTAWVVAPDSDIGALAYSGKLMTPHVMPDILSDVMRACEATLSSRNILGEDEGFGMNFFDCALCNHYPDGDSACKFHTDPEHGSHWDRTTVVVSAGQDRKFAFRPIPQITTWNEWDKYANNNRNSNAKDVTTSDDNMAAITHLFSGDLVVMKDQCNDIFHHAVHAAEPGQGISSGPLERISLVLKRALDRGGGSRGHGLQGQGRRRSKNNPRVTMSSPESSGTRGKASNKNEKRTTKQRHSTINGNNKKKASPSRRSSNNGTKKNTTKMPSRRSPK